MAKISLEQIQTNTEQISMFKLSDDGQEAIVRFMVDSIDDLEILTTHNIKVNDKHRKVSCVRDPKEDTSLCPLCNADVPVNQLVYIKMLQYIDNGTSVETKPVIWERNASTYAYKMKGYVDNYGPMSGILCKVIRHGKAGDIKTTYDIIPNINPSQYPQEKFPIPQDDPFEDYSAEGTIVMSKSVQDIETFIQTGVFPQQTQQQPMQQEQYYSQPQQQQYTPQPQQTYSPDSDSQTTYGKTPPPPEHFAQKTEHGEQLEKPKRVY